MSDSWKVHATEKGGRWWVQDEVGGLLFACSQRWADQVVREHNELQELRAAPQGHIRVGVVREVLSRLLNLHYDQRAYSWHEVQAAISAVEKEAEQSGYVPQTKLAFVRCTRGAAYYDSSKCGFPDCKCERVYEQSGISGERANG